MKYILITSILFLFASLHAGAQQVTPPTLHALLMEKEPEQKVLFIFNNGRQARTWATVAGFTAIAVGGYLGGKAEMHQRYHGTTENFDNFHLTRDAGLLITGLGAGALGASITIGQKPQILDVLWKAATGAILYRITAQATYNATKPRQ